MDHQNALNQLRSQRVLNAAFDYAIFDRTNGDYFADSVEIEYARTNRDELIDEIIQELSEPSSYTPRTAFAFFPPKNELCDRRLIYIPIKDLTIRYAFAIIFSGQIEAEIHPQCFANRRASGTEAQTRFTQDFSTGGWARFCRWQSDQCVANTVLLRTDISSFYDSVSHEYLIDSICRHLILPRESAFIQLFKALLQIPVIYYSPRTGLIEGPAVTHQGLPLGDGVEGYLANLFLKDVDDAMIQSAASYGRYVDDIRLFGTNRQEVLRHLRIFQEQLLRKGLNLNASKTEIAEDDHSRQLMISRIYYDLSGNEVEVETAGSVLLERVDAPFEEFSRTFTEGALLESGGDAKDFCKFLAAHTLNGQPVVPLAERQTWHVTRLSEIISRWRGPTKHASWLLAQTAAYRGVPNLVQQEARTATIALLEDETVNSYSRYRILHHLIKPRSGRGTSFRFIDHFSGAEQQRIQGIIPVYLAAPAFELNLIAIEFLRSLGTSVENIRILTAQHCRPSCEPVRNAVSSMTNFPETESGSFHGDVDADSIPEIPS